MTWDKHTNKRILTLHPEIRDRVTQFVNDVQNNLNIKIRVTQAFRSIEMQDGLYAKGRTDAGRIVTKVKGGYSYHNYGLAFDICIIENGKAIFKITPEIAALAIIMGFIWGGHFLNKKQRQLPQSEQNKLKENGDGWDVPHFQMTYGYTCEQLMNRKLINGYVHL